MALTLSKFRRVFQDLPECRATLISCISGASLIALRRAIGFWLSEKEKRAHLSLFGDIFEHIEWNQDMGEVIMIGPGLDFRRAEAIIQEATLKHWKKVFPFMIMIRPPFDFQNLDLWTTQALSSITRSTKMPVMEAAKRPDFWDATPIATIEGFAAGVEISIPITTLAQDASQSQLGHATMNRAAAMSIFQPVLDDMTQIAVVKKNWASVTYQTGNVAANKANDTFSACMFGPHYMAEDSILHQPPFEGTRRSPQIVTQVIYIYSPAEPDPACAA